MFLTVEFIKNLVNVILTFQLTSKKGGYINIKYKNASFMEENGKLLWLFIDQNCQMNYKILLNTYYL